MSKVSIVPCSCRLLFVDESARPGREQIYMSFGRKQHAKCAQCLHAERYSSYLVYVRRLATSGFTLFGDLQASGWDRLVLHGTMGFVAVGWSRRLVATFRDDLTPFI